MMSRLNPSAFHLKYTSRQEGENTLYVFSPKDNAAGYVVVSADDCGEALLGYSSAGRFEADALPPAMTWWLEEYGRQIAAARDRGVARVVERPEREPIAPMVTTTWNQDAPYNNMCPVINSQRSMTGCVATAMAQVVNYHEWPERGVGSHQYYYNGSWISLDFSNITFDWNSMRDSYAGGAGTERQKSAVAQLMYACGVSVDMQYSPVQSGAPDVFVAGALVDYFGYDKGVRYAERDYFGMLEWEDFMYSQLKDYGPVQYSGSSSAGGHSFVCDGYDGDGFFHINWGWGGVSDGFFRLSALEPANQGIGGSSSGFNYDQAVVGNICKPKAKSEMYLNLMMDSGFDVAPVKTTSATKPGDQITVTRRVINYSIATASGSLGVKFTNTATGEVKYGVAPSRFSLQPLNPLSSYTTQIPSGLKTGTYELSPVVCGTDGIWKDVPVKLSTVQKVIMTVKYGECTFAPANDGNVSVTDVEILTPIYLGNLFRMKARITNPGSTEFVGDIVPTLASGSSPIAKTNAIHVDLLPGDDMDIEFCGIFNHFASSAYPNPGTYTFYMVKEATNQIVSEGIEVELHAVPDTKLSVSDFKIEGDPEAVNPDNLTFTGTVKCDEGYFGRNLTVVIFPYKDGQLTSVGFYNTQDLFIEEGGSASFTAGGVLAGAEDGARYFAVLYDGQTEVSDSGSLLVFKVSKRAGIEGVTVGNECTHLRVFTATGVPVMESDGMVDIEALPIAAGVYILEFQSADGTRTVTKVAKR